MGKLKNLMYRLYAPRVVRKKYGYGTTERKSRISKSCDERIERIDKIDEQAVKYLERLGKVIRIITKYDR